MSATPNNRLFVANIDPESTNAEIIELFKDYPVKSIKAPTLKRRGIRSRRGFVFVHFDTSDSAVLEEIINKFTDFEFKGKNIHISYSEPKSKLEKEIKSEESIENSPEDKPKKKSTKKSRKSKAKKDSESESADITSVSEPKKTSKKKETRIKPARVPLEEGKRSVDSLLFGNIPRDAQQDELEEFVASKDDSFRYLFLPTSKIRKALIIEAKEKGEKIFKRNKGIAFVKFEISTDGETLDEKIEKFKGIEFKGNPLRVEVVVETRVDIINPPKQEVVSTESKAKANVATTDA